MGTTRVKRKEKEAPAGRKDDVNERQIIRHGRQFKNARKSLKQEHLFGLALATLEDLNLFQTEELRDYLRQFEHYRGLTNIRILSKSVEADISQNWMEWICLIWEIYVECTNRLGRWREDHAEELKNNDESDQLSCRAVAAQLSKARYQLKKSLFKNLKSLSKKFSTNRAVDFTILDIYLRLGAVEEFDIFISSLVLRYPTDAAYWYLAIRRRIASGDYLASLTLCQKALRFCPSDKELDCCLRRLSFIIASADAARSLLGEDQAISAISPTSSSELDG